MKTFITLDSNLDNLENIKNTELDPPGKATIIEIANLLRNRGYESSAPDMHDSYGWYIDITTDNGSFCSMIQASDNFLIISEENRTLWQRFRGQTSSEFVPYLEVLRNVIESSEHFNNIQFFSRDEFES